MTFIFTRGSLMIYLGQVILRRPSGASNIHRSESTWRNPQKVN